VRVVYRLATRVVWIQSSHHARSQREKRKDRLPCSCPQPLPAHAVNRRAMRRGARGSREPAPRWDRELRLTAWTADEAGANGGIRPRYSRSSTPRRPHSVWREGSDISRLNAAAGEHAVPISPEVRETLRMPAKSATGPAGRFDITFGVLSGLWKFDYQDKNNTIPDRGEVLSGCPLSIIATWRLTTGGHGVLKRKGMRVNIGRNRQGYAVDRAVDIPFAGGIS